MAVERKVDLGELERSRCELQAVVDSRVEVSAEELFGWATRILGIRVGEVWRDSEEVLLATGRGLLLTLCYFSADLENPEEVWLDLREADGSIRVYVVRKESESGIYDLGEQNVDEGEFVPVANWGNLAGGRLAQILSDAHTNTPPAGLDYGVSIGGKPKNGGGSVY